MLKHLWIKILILLVAVSVVALSSALFLRELMIRDFAKYLEGEREDRVYWLTASLESSFERHAGWNREKLVEDTIWALMLGYDIRIFDSSHSLVMDTETATVMLSPMTKKRVASLSGTRTLPEHLNYVPYTLFLGGTEIGSIEVALLRPGRAQVFVSRSNRLLLISLALLGGLALVLSIVSARRFTSPLERLTEGVTAISGGDLTKRVHNRGGDELARLSEAFNKMALSLERQESLRKRLTANIAHELRTPVSAIRGELEGMIDGLLPVDRDGLQSLLTELNRLRLLLDGIEELSQAEASGIALHVSTFPVGTFLKNVIGRFRGLAAEKSLSLRLDAADTVSVTADPDRLSQIMINIISNAVKACSPGGSIAIRAFRSDHATTIEVADTGKGISPEDLPYIFERFYRTGTGGLGLGLTITKELVEAHGGSISVQSSPGHGSAFQVRLPDPS